MEKDNAEDPISFQVKAGEIYITNPTKKYSFICTFCNAENFNNFEKFCKHIEECHLYCTSDIEKTDEENGLSDLDDSNDKHLQHLHDSTNESKSDSSDSEWNSKIKSIIKTKNWIKSSVVQNKPKTIKKKNEKVLKKYHQHTGATKSSMKCKYCNIFTKTITATNKSCNKCRKYYLNKSLLKFKKPQQLQYHNRESNFIKKKKNLRKSFKCNHCKKKFSKRHLLAVHIRIHTKARPYKCELCSKSYISAIQMLWHKKEHLSNHSLESNKYLDVFPINTISDHLERFKSAKFHYQEFDKYQENGYKCDKCNQTFLFESSYETHSRLHYIAEKSFECKICSLSFDEETEFLNHKRRHDENQLNSKVHS